MIFKWHFIAFLQIYGSLLHTYTEIDRQTDRQRERDRQTDRQTDKQIDR